MRTERRPFNVRLHEHCRAVYGSDIDQKIAVMTRRANEIQSGIVKIRRQLRESPLSLALAARPHCSPHEEILALRAENARLQKYVATLLAPTGAPHAD